MSRNFAAVPSVRIGTRRPAAAALVTDAESGNDGAGLNRDLFALKVMADRGLIPPDEYERRRAEMLSGTPDNAA